MTYLGGKAMAAIMADHDQGEEYALVECIARGCNARRRIAGSAALTDRQIIELLAEGGWTIKPTLCPDHAQSGDQS